MPHSYLIASAGRVLAALHAGYMLPSAPNSTATPNPSSTSSGVMATEIDADEAEPMDTPAVDTVLFPAWVGWGSSRLASDVLPPYQSLNQLRPRLSSTAHLQA